MNRRSLLRNLAAAGAGLYLSRPSLAEEPQDYLIHSDVRLVLLDVRVQDHTGALVSDLMKENFQVFENGKRQPITVFDHDDMPVTLGLIVDESRSMTPKRAEVIRAAEALIAESNRSDEIFVLNFNEDVKTGLPPETPFTDDPHLLHDALYRGLPEGRTALNDAIVAGLKQLESGQRAKKTLVVISDGGDNISMHNKRDTLEMVENTVATIYTIGIFDADDPDVNPGFLRDLAGISGGEAYFPMTAKEMLPICHRIARDIRSRYTVGYLPPEGSNNSLRHIEVRASTPEHNKLNAKTRSTYRYEPLQPKAHK
jgi:Ca-activated chloride channel family protein